MSQTLFMVARSRCLRGLRAGELTAALSVQWSRLSDVVLTRSFVPPVRHGPVAHATRIRKRDRQVLANVTIESGQPGRSRLISMS